MSESIVDFDYTFIPYPLDIIREKGLDSSYKVIPNLYSMEVYYKSLVSYIFI